jgi:hypothetical protein
VITRPQLGQMTQGVVFAGAFADQYTNAPVWGLCITARCDAAHDKAPVFNYLPIVRFEDWLLVDGRRVLCDQLHADSLSSAANRLRQRKFSPSVLDSYSPKEVAKKFFPVEPGQPDKEAMQFHELADRIDQIRTIAAAKSCELCDMASLASEGEKITERLLRDLVRNGVSGYYFLASVGDTEHASERGYVVLVREVHHVASTVIRRIADGIDKETWTAEMQAISPLRVPNFDTFEFALPTAQITSPHIEHILQVFGMLFMRIGVPDPDSSILQKLRGAFGG